MKIKIVDERRKLSMMSKGTEEFITALKYLLHYPVEIIKEIDEHFEGYQIVIYETHKEDAYLKNLRNDNIFLVGVINADINRLLTSYNPLGLIQWRLFRNKTTSICGLNTVWKKNNIDLTENRKGNNDYTFHFPIKSDSSYLSMAKAVLIYLEMHHKLRTKYDENNS